MDIKEAIKARHSVRQYQDTRIEESVREQLNALAGICNKESGLHIQIVYDDPECFQTLTAHYGKFSNVKNYIAIVGDKSIENLEELGGYYGEKIVLYAQQLGLNTCWVGGTYSKGKCKADKDKGEKLVCVIALGYGKNEGVKHKSKPINQLCNIAEPDMPVWFKNGMVAARLAPTAINQQKFYVTLDQDEVTITAKKGVLSNVDLGIVKYHFEVASGRLCK